MRKSIIIDTTPPDLVADLGTGVVESHLRLTYSDEPLYIDALAAAAVRSVEFEANEQHGAGTVSVYANNVPTSLTIPVGADRFTLTAVEYLNESGAWTAVDEDDYGFTTQGNPLVFEFIGEKLPDDYDTEAVESFRITGTVAAKTMPKNLQQACLLMLAHLYQNREAVVNEKIYELPLAFTYLIGKSRNTPLR